MKSEIEKQAPSSTRIEMKRNHKTNSADLDTTCNFIRAKPTPRRHFRNERTGKLDEEEFHKISGKYLHARCAILNVTFTSELSKMDGIGSDRIGQGEIDR